MNGNHMLAITKYETSGKLKIMRSQNIKTKESMKTSERIKKQWTI